MDLEKMKRALALMTEALALLDEAESPPDIGAHLDVAVNALQDSMGAFGQPVEAFRSAGRFQ